MTAIYGNGRLVKRTYWLIRLRWVATVSVAAGTFVSANIMHIEILQPALYAIAILLAIYNGIMFGLMNYYCRDYNNINYDTIRRMIRFQICADLVILTCLLHFSGGIENPFVFYFIFHMIITSILLSVRESYLLASFAVLLFGFLVLLEYLGLLPHHCLKGYVANCQYRDGPYILGTFTAFTSAVFLVVYMTSDISMKLKQAENAYRQANILLREKDRIKDEYVARVTHDIKGHLASITNCLDVLKDNYAGPLNEKQSEFIGRAHTRTQKLMNFVRTLLKLTQMRLSNKLEMEPFSLRETIDNALAAAENRAQEKSIVIRRRIALTNECVLGNEFSIEEMITNIILNAIKYTPASGMVEIIAENDKNNVVVKIVDTGIGIPNEDIPKIFDEFFRAKNARQIEKDGTGLGLAISKQIIERHKGRIWVESKEGSGSTFTLTLPKTPCRFEPKEIKNDLIHGLM